jgi:lysophospholipase L1-like esterase
MRLLIVGDSIAAGAVDVDSGEVRGTVHPTFVDLLRDRLDSWRIELDAAPLRRTVEAATGIGELLARHTPDVVLLATGSNDADIDWRRFILTKGASVRSRTRPREFEAAVRTVHACVRAAGSRLVLTDAIGVSLEVRGPVLDSVAGCDVQAMIRAAGGQPEADRMADEHCQFVCGLAEQLECGVALVGASLRACDPREVLGPDGLHPSAAGHRILAEGYASALTTVGSDSAAPGGREGAAR